MYSLLHCLTGLSLDSTHANDATTHKCVGENTIFIFALMKYKYIIACLLQCMGVWQWFTWTMSTFTPTGYQIWHIRQMQVVLLDANTIYHQSSIVNTSCHFKIHQNIQQTVRA